MYVCKQFFDLRNSCYMPWKTQYTIQNGRCERGKRCVGVGDEI